MGGWVWHELASSDPAAAARFYCGVFGWTARDSGMPGMAYTLLLQGEAHVGGVMAPPPGAHPGWVGYVGVEDVDAAAAQAVALGGKVLAPAMDIPGVGRFAVIADPQCAVLCLFRGQGEAPAVPPMQPGHVVWNELMAADMPAAWPFYAAMFGWTRGEALDMGPMGTYQLYAAGGTVVGGMMTKPAQMPMPAWQFYVAVPDVDAAVARIRAGGGQVIHGPMEVPGGAWAGNALDPQGVAFGFVGARGG